MLSTSEWKIWQDAQLKYKLKEQPENAIKQEFQYSGWQDNLTTAAEYKYQWM